MTPSTEIPYTAWTAKVRSAARWMLSLRMTPARSTTVAASGGRSGRSGSGRATIPNLPTGYDNDRDGERRNPLPEQGVSLRADDRIRTGDPHLGKVRLRSTGDEETSRPAVVRGRRVSVPGTASGTDQPVATSLGDAHHRVPSCALPRGGTIRSVLPGCRLSMKSKESGVGFDRPVSPE